MDHEVVIKRGVSMLAFTLIPTALLAPLPIEPWLGWRWDSRTFSFHSTPIGTLRLEPRSAAPEPPAASAGTPALAVDDVRNLQRVLLERGVYQGPLDGTAGDQTIAAAVQLERQRCESRLEELREGRASAASWTEAVRSP